MPYAFQNMATPPWINSHSFVGFIKTAAERYIKGKVVPVLN
jgi:hypothetical protein